MAENDREDEIRLRYRELAREEPPRALDDAILAAARRELETRPAPLVAPTGRRRWAVPVAAAAVIVLSAVLTLHVQREQPDAELGAPQVPQAPARKDEEGVVAPDSVAPRAEMQEDKLAARPKEVEAQRENLAASKVQRQRQRAQEAPSAKAAKPVQPPAASALATAPAEPKPPADPGRFSPDPGPVAAAPAPPPASAPAPQMQRQAVPALQPAPRATDRASEERRAIGGLRDSQRFETRAPAKREAGAESPEKMLERIAVLRREGRQKEADDLYAEFRKRFPDYRIPEAMREQVLPR